MQPQPNPCCFLPGCLCIPMVNPLVSLMHLSFCSQESFNITSQDWSVPSLWNSSLFPCFLKKRQQGEKTNKQINHLCDSLLWGSGGNGWGYTTSTHTNISLLSPSFLREASYNVAQLSFLHYKHQHFKKICSDKYRLFGLNLTFLSIFPVSKGKGDKWRFICPLKWIRSHPLHYRASYCSKQGVFLSEKGHIIYCLKGMPN